MYQVHVPPATVPAYSSGFTDRMTFLQRCQNAVVLLALRAISRFLWNPHIIAFRRRHGIYIAGQGDQSYNNTLLSITVSLSGAPR